MNIISSFKVNGEPQRKLLTHNGRTYRRIVAWVNSKGQITDRLNSPVWQEQIHTGDFHNVMDCNELEIEFQKLKNKLAPSQ